MNNIPARLRSRKLWVALLTAGTFVALGQYTEALGTIIAYLTAQGAEDVAGRLSGTPK